VFIGAGLRFGSIPGVALFTNPTQSTGTNSGAIVVSGGAGINGNLNVAGRIVGGGVRSTTSPTAPANPTEGDWWYDTTNDVLLRYTYDGVSFFWFDNSSAIGSGSTYGGAGGGTGGTATSNTGTLFEKQYSIPGQLTIANAAMFWYAATGIRITNIIARVNIAPIGSGIVLSITRNGVQVVSMTIPNMQLTSTAYTVPITAAAGDYFGVNVGTVGTALPGSNLAVTFLYTRNL
jgi:hypothetical protein